MACLALTHTVGLSDSFMPRIIAHPVHTLPPDFIKWGGVSELCGRVVDGVERERVVREINNPRGSDPIGGAESVGLSRLNSNKGYILCL